MPSNVHVLRILLLAASLQATTSAVANNDIFSNISVTASNDEINQCVREVNQAADDDLNTSSRLYQTGLCYFCIECDFEADNGELFLVNETIEFSTDLSSHKNYETAHKLISQAAGLGNHQAYYALAVLLYASGISDNRKTESELIQIESAEEEQTKSNNQQVVVQLAQQSNSVFRDIVKKTGNTDFSKQIHSHLLVSAKQGYLPAQFALSEVYAKGVGINQDAVQAYAWAATAVAQNPPFGSLRRDEKAIVLDSIKLNQAESIAEEYMKNYTNIYDRASVTVMR